MNAHLAVRAQKVLVAIVSFNRCSGQFTRLLNYYDPVARLQTF